VNPGTFPRGGRSVRQRWHMHCSIIRITYPDMRRGWIDTMASLAAVGALPGCRCLLSVLYQVTHSQKANSLWLADSRELVEPETLDPAYHQHTLICVISNNNVLICCFHSSIKMLDYFYRVSFELLQFRLFIDFPQFGDIKT